MNVLSPDQQKDLGDLMALDAFEAERIWRKEAHAMAKIYFEMANPPQSPQEIAEIGPIWIAICAGNASMPVSAQLLLRIQHASRAAFFERMRVLMAEDASTVIGTAS